jgi:hypothetical protein
VTPADTCLKAVGVKHPDRGEQRVEHGGKGWSGVGGSSANLNRTAKPAGTDGVNGRPNFTV